MGSKESKMEILLEKIRSNLKAVAEGHSDIHRKIDDFRQSVDQKFTEVQLVQKEQGRILKDHSEDLQEIKSDLKEHIRQTVPPAHVAV